MHEERDRVTQTVSCLGYLRLSERENFIGGGALILYLVVLLIAVSYSWQYVDSRWLSFEMDASATESSMSGTSMIVCT